MKNTQHLYFTLFLLLLKPVSPYISGQQPCAGCDTVYVPRGYLVVFNDTILRFEADTTLLLPDTCNYKVKKDREYHSDAFYNGFKDKSQENKFLKGLYDVMISEQKDTTGQYSRYKTENYRPEFADKKVGSIDILAVDLIEGDVNNPMLRASGKFSTTLNKLHKDSRQAVIRKSLTIREGDLLGPYTLSDNEHHLRSLEYIEDAKIYAVTDSLDPGVLHILVVFKDVFPFTTGLAMGGLTDYTFELNNVNIAGTGHEFSNAFNFNNSRDPVLAYDGKLIFSNLWGSFVNAEIRYRNNYRGELSKVSLNRDFLTPETKYGGGIELYNQKTSLDVLDSDSNRITIPYTKNYLDQWIGRSFLLNEIERQRIVLKLRYMSTRYTRRPEVESDTNQQFYNINLLIGSVSLLKIDHYKERMLLGFGMVEDIDFGYAIELTYGYQFSEFFNAPYLGLSLKGSNKFKFGYLGGGIEYGGHFHQQNIAQGLFRTGFTYYSPLMKTNIFDIRLISRMLYTEGIRRYSYEFQNLGKEVRGISNKGIKGDKRMIARFELATFIKGNLLGFRFSPNLFYDAAFIASGSELFISDNFFSVMGAGVRIRNENLAFRTLILRFGYYTGNPLRDASFGVGFSTSVPDVIRDYDIVKPDLLQY